jgi:DNA topoisomerase VI subunit B
MIYLLNNNTLPWSNFHLTFSNYELKDYLRERQKLEYTKELFNIVPKPLKNMVKSILTLEFEEEPPYDYIIEKIKEQILNLKEESTEPHNFEWTHN